MDQLNDALGKLLNDPDAMSQVMQMVQAIVPQEEAGKSAHSLPELGKLLGSVKGDERHTALFRALLPFLSQRRQEKLERAMQLARLSSIASLALGQEKKDDAKGV